MYGTKQCLHVGCARRYLAASLALTRPCLSKCVWMTVCTTVLDLGYHIGSWPQSKILYDIVIRNATLYGVAPGLQHNHKFVVFISECGCRLNGLDRLLRTAEKSAGAHTSTDFFK